MLNYTKKKKNKLNTYRAVRESIQLNKNNVYSTEQTNTVNYENLVFQIGEIKLVHHLNKHKKGQAGKLMFKWWEN